MPPILSASLRVLLGHEAQPGREVLAGAEARRVAHGHHQRGGRHRPHAGMAIRRRQVDRAAQASRARSTWAMRTWASRICSRRRASIACAAASGRTEAAVSRTRSASSRRFRSVARHEAELGQAAAHRVDQLGGVAGPGEPWSRSMVAACCSAVLTGTKRMVGRTTASPIASASAASFLLPRRRAHMRSIGSTGVVGIGSSSFSFDIPGLSPFKTRPASGPAQTHMRSPPSTAAPTSRIRWTGLRRTRPLNYGVRGQTLRRFVRLDPPGVIRSRWTSGLRSSRPSGGLHHGAFNDNAGGRVLPRRDQQLPRQRHDRRLLRRPPLCRTRPGNRRLSAEPGWCLSHSHGQLDQHGPQPWVARLRHALFMVDGAACQAWVPARQAANCAGCRSAGRASSDQRAPAIQGRCS